MYRAIVLGAAIAATFFGAAASAEDFYQGRTLRIIVGSDAGGGYDRYARLLQRHMTQYIPGKPSIVVMNMPGAGGLVLANNLQNQADKDGTVFGMFNRYIVYMPLLGNQQARFKPDQFMWLGTTASYATDAYLMVIRSALPHRTVEDLRNPKMPLMVGSNGTDVPAILKEALGFNLKMIAGYKGSDEMEFAFERGEVDAHTSGWSSIQSRHPDWLEKNFIRPVVQFGRVDRLPALPDIPTARELAQTPEDRALIEFAEVPLLMARPFALPPGVPADRVEMLRTAFMKTMSDPGYLEEASKQKLEYSPKSGSEVQDIVRNLGQVSPTVLERYKKALGGRAPSGG